MLCTSVCDVVCSDVRDNVVVGHLVFCEINVCHLVQYEEFNDLQWLRTEIGQEKGDSYFVNNAHLTNGQIIISLNSLLSKHRSFKIRIWIGVFRGYQQITLISILGSSECHSLCYVLENVLVVYCKVCFHNAFMILFSAIELLEYYPRCNKHDPLPVD